MLFEPDHLQNMFSNIFACNTLNLWELYANSRIQTEKSQNYFFQNCSAHKDTKLCLALLQILEFPPKYHWKEMACFLRAGRTPWEGHPARVVSVQLSMTTARQSPLAVIMGWNYFHKHKNFHWNIPAHKGLYPESCMAAR